MKINKNNFKFIYIEITKKCNLKCPFCPSSSLKKNESMEVDEFRKIISEVRKHTNTIYLHILGEPLLHSDFSTIVKLAYQFGLKVRLTTNGVFINKYDFCDLPIAKISISLQALVDFSKEKVYEYLDNLQVFFSSISDKLKKGEIGVDLRMWNSFEKAKFSNLKETIDTFFKENDILNLKNVRISKEDEFIWPSEKNKEDDSLMMCLGGKTHLGILVNGDVVLCCLDYLGQTFLGNIKEKTLAQILEDEPYQKAMQMALSKQAYFELCKKCTYKNRFNKKGGD